MSSVIEVVIEQVGDVVVNEPVVKVVEVGVAGPQGPPGPAGAGGSSYTHTQASPASTWTINHNLGYRPVVALFTVGGVEFWAQVLHTSTNQVQVLLNTALAGTARLV